MHAAAIFSTTVLIATFLAGCQPDQALFSGTSGGSVEIVDPVGDSVASADTRRVVRAVGLRLQGADPAATRSATGVDTPPEIAPIPALAPLRLERAVVRVDEPAQLVTDLLYADSIGRHAHVLAIARRAPGSDAVSALDAGLVAEAPPRVEAFLVPEVALADLGSDVATRYGSLYRAAEVTAVEPPAAGSAPYAVFLFPKSPLPPDSVIDVALEGSGGTDAPVPLLQPSYGGGWTVGVARLRASAGEGPGTLEIQYRQGRGTPSTIAAFPLGPVRVATAE